MGRGKGEISLVIKGIIPSSAVSQIATKNHPKEKFQFILMKTMLIFYQEFRN